MKRVNGSSGVNSVAMASWKDQNMVLTFAAIAGVIRSAECVLAKL